MSSLSYLILDFKKKFSNIKPHDKFFILSIFIYPVTIIAGPAVIEILIFFNIVLFILKFNDFKKYFNENYLKIIILIYCFLICSSLASEFKLHSLKSSLFIIRFCIFYFIVYSILIKYDFVIKYLCYFYILIIIFLIFDVFIQVIFEKNIFLIERQTSTIHAGMFGEEKKLASYLIRIAPITFGLILWADNIKNKFYLIISLTFLLFCCLFFTSERLAFIYFFILIFFIFIILIKEKILKPSRLFCILFIFSIIPGILFYSYNYTFKQKIIDTHDQIFYGNKLNFYSVKHEAFAKTSIYIFKDNLFLGGGPNNYRNLFKNYNIPQNLSNHPHNFFFQVLADLGLPGLVIYVYFFLLLCKSLLKSFSTKQYSITFFVLSIFFYVNPFFPSGNLFNNWFMAIGSYSLPFIFAFLKKIR
jgi:O-antigen ligase